MAAQQVQNRDGVVVTVELVEDEASEFHGLYRVTDKDGTVGHISDEQFRRNFVPAGTSKPAPDTSKQG